MNLRLRRAAILVRISEDPKVGTENEGLGVQRQAKDCRARIAFRTDWVEAGYYEDNDVDALGKKARVALERLIKDIEAGRIDVVVAWSFERICKRRIDQARFMKVCKRHGVLLSLINGGEIDLSTSAGEFMADMLGGTARFENGQKVERQARRALQDAERGIPHFGPRPFGFQADRVTHDPAEAAAVREAYREVIAGGNLSKIARTLNAAGFRTSRGNEWKPNGVRQMILNPRNMGVRTYTRTSIDEETGAIVHETPQDMGRAVWDPIVDADTFNAARHVLGGESRKTNKVGGQPRWLLSGVAECGNCHGRMISTYRGKGIRVYRCKKCSMTRRADFCDTVVRDRMVGMIAAGELLTPPVTVGGTDIAAAREEIAKLRINKKAVMELAMETGNIAAAREALAHTDGRIQRLEAVLAAQRLHPDIEALAGAQDPAGAWDGLSVDRQRALVERVGGVVLLVAHTRILTPDTIAGPDVRRWGQHLLMHGFEQERA